MKTIHLPRTILSVYLISLIYWVYLAVVNNMSADLIDYVKIGRMLHQQGWIAFFKTGPHREPLYPLLISWALSLESLTGIVYSKITLAYDILMLMTVQVLTYYMLRRLNVRTWICFFALLYLAVSPEITNMAFNQFAFSEIAVYPFIPLIIILGYKGWNAVKQGRSINALGYGVAVGLVFTVATFVKGVFELIFPSYLILFLAAAILKNRLSVPLVCFLTAAAVLFYIPITGYKLLNKQYNGDFTITDSRGPMAFYGNIARRTGPLTFKKYLVALSYVPPGMCGQYFNQEECDFWSFNESDALGGRILNDQKLSRHTSMDTLFYLFKENSLIKLFKYFVLTVTESLKMFFWGAASPFGPILTFFGIIYGVLSIGRLPALMGHIFIFVFLYVFFHTLGCILPRYILPIVPLYVIIISYALHSIMSDKKFYLSRIWHS